MQMKEIGLRNWIGVGSSLAHPPLGPTNADCSVMDFFVLKIHSLKSFEFITNSVLVSTELSESDFHINLDLNYSTKIFSCGSMIYRLAGVELAFSKRLLSSF